jgi:hypothetical protein
VPSCWVQFGGNSACAFRLNQPSQLYVYYVSPGGVRTRQEGRTHIIAPIGPARFAKGNNGRTVCWPDDLNMVRMTMAELSSTTVRQTVTEALGWRSR